MRYIKVALILLAGGAVLFASSCASLRDLRIDPSGRCLFTTQPQSGVVPNTTGNEGQPGTVANPSAALPFPGSSQTGTGASSSSETNAPSPFRFPGGFGASVPGTGTGAGFAGADGEGIYTTSTPPEPIKGPAVILTPKTFFAPVDSEIVIVASYLGKDEYLRTNQPIEWSLEGAGHILTYDTGSWCDWWRGDFSNAKKINDRFVRTKTSANLWTIDRGTVDTKDDIEILKGQTWITLKSTKEGTSYVNAFSPTINDWKKRSAASTVHWIDAQFAFPRTTLAAVGDSRKLTTIISRKSNGTPRSGWFVEYEVVGGTPAGFGESRAQRVKVPTDLSGQASVDVYQNESSAGTTAIAVRAIRPETGDGSDEELVVGSTIMRQTWTAGGVLRINVSGPEDPVADQDYAWKVHVENASSQPTSATIHLILPYGLRYVSSGRHTPSQITPSMVQWELEAIPGRGTFDMDVMLRADGQVVGTGRSLDVIAHVYPRAAGSRTPILPSTGSPPDTPPDTGPEAAPYQPPPAGPDAPVPPPPASPPGTGTQDPFSGIIDNELIRAKLSVARHIGNADGSAQLQMISTPYQMNRENRWIVFAVEANKTNQVIRNLQLVIYPPQKGGSIVKSLKYVSGNANHTYPERDDLIVLRSPIAPSSQTDTDIPKTLSLGAQFEPQAMDNNVIIFGEIFDGRNRDPIGSCKIQVSVSQY